MRKLLLSATGILMAFFSNAQLDSTSLLAYPQLNNNSYLSIPTPVGSNLRVSGSFTIEAWILPNSSTLQESFVVETYDEPYMGGFVLRLSEQNKVRAYKKGSSASQTVNITGTTPVTMNQWNHIAMKYDSANNTLSVYLNGVEDGVTPCNTNVVNLNPAMKIGARGDDNTIWNGLRIDDVRIWNYARTTAEINVNKSVCLDGTETGLLAAYDFEGLTNSTVIDNSGNGNNGTIINFGSQSLQNGVTQCEMPCPTSSIDVQATCDTSFTWIDGVTYFANNNTATHVLMNAGGCDSIITLNLTITAINTGVTQANETLTSQETGATYQWIDCNDNSPIAGATNASFTATSNGSYAVKVTKSSCTETSTCYSVTTLGVENLSAKSYKLYPNPVTDVLKIESQENVQQVSLYSITGQLLITITPQSNMIEVDVAPFVSGIYILKIQNNNGNIIINRVVKK